MDRLTERLDMAGKALKSLKELAVDAHADPIQRDAAIKRFELAFEAVWKAAQRLAQDAGKGPTGSPRSCIRWCREDGVLSEEDAEGALKLVGDRNLATHTYALKLAIELDGRLPGHAALLERWLAALDRRASEDPPATR